MSMLPVDTLVVCTRGSAARLFDELKIRHGLRSDSALAAVLELEPTNISRLRHGRVPLGPSLILNVHETFGLPVAEIRALSGAVRRID
jgi:plasmid maintenance system antidote protein VapI